MGIRMKLQQSYEEIEWEEELEGKASLKNYQAADGSDITWKNKMVRAWHGLNTVEMIVSHPSTHSYGRNGKMERKKGTKQG